MQYYLKRLSVIIYAVIAALLVSAQTAVPVRYVTKDGAYINDGRSWQTPKANIQEAINDLQDYMQRNNLTEGHVYVGAGTYTPTESTESSNDGIHYTSFKIPEGIKVYGGFTAKGLKDGSTTDYQTNPTERYMKNGKTQAENDALDQMDVDYLENHSNQWAMRDVTLLSGDHSVGATHGNFLKWNTSHQQYDMQFPGNSYHVVWFATNGFIAIEDTTKANRGAPLNHTALLDGVTIKGGYASTGVSDVRNHTGYGGGVYMVDGAELRNCIVTDNAASRRGGGVYCDGGGLVEYCHITGNQTLGQGLTDGYGGGVCIDHYGVVKLSLVTENCARIGGGVALDMQRDIYPYAHEGGAYYRNAFSAIVAGCLVANNSAMTEAGGMAMIEGGTANHVTIVRNHCSGSIITSEQRRYGRSGGLYVDTGASVFNSVVWGNTTISNGNVQYASYIPSSNTAGDSVVPYISFSAFSDLDNSDWTGSTIQGVIALQAQNARSQSTRNATMFYPAFADPCALSSSGVAGVECVPEDGITSKDYIKKWIPANYSDLLARGISLNDYLTSRSVNMSMAYLSASLTGRRFAPVNTLGAFIGEPMKVKAASGIAGVEGDGATVETVFVDPSFYRAPSATSSAISESGESWDNPVCFLGDALYYAQQATKMDANAVVQILVKEGTVPVHSRPINFDASTEAERTRLRDLSANLTGKVRLYGGYYGNLTGTSLDKILADNGSYIDVPRNPKDFQTILSGNVTGLTYTDNVAHVVTIDNNANGVVLDGFKIDGGNSQYNDNLMDEWHWRPTTTNGAGVLIDGAKNTKIRNCIISNSTAYHDIQATETDALGAALYAKGAEGLQISNLIVHNNTSTTKSDTEPSAVYLTDCIGTVSIDHALLRGNIGGLVVDNTALSLTNTAFHANGKSSLAGKMVESASFSAGNVLTVTTVNGGTVTGHHNMCDQVASLPMAATNYKAVLTYSLQNNTNFTYPRFANPTNAVGVQTSGDITIYGGLPDFTPNNMNPMVNAAHAESAANPGYDFTTVNLRNSGGLPDIGAIENSELPPYGEVVFVRTETDGGNDANDGLSWDSPKASIHAAQNVAGVKQIWVAAGTYTGVLTNDETLGPSWFRMIDGIDMYGGFAKYGHPGMSDPLERDISNSKAEFQTILKAGDENGINTGSNAGRVLMHTASTTPTIMEGFTLTNGNLQGKFGAGAYLLENGTLKNCKIENNTSDYPGAGVYVYGGTIKNSIIRKNISDKTDSEKDGGAGVYIGKAGSVLINSLIVENTAKTINATQKYILGAGVYTSAKGIFYNCTIAYNFADNGGKAAVTGGVWDGTKSSQFYNCIFWGNTGNGNTGENFVQVGMSGWDSGSGTNNQLYDCYTSSLIVYTSGSGVSSLDEIDPTRTFITHPNLDQGKPTNGNAITKMYEEFINVCNANMPFVDRVYYALKKGDESSTSRYCINMGGSENIVVGTMNISEDITGANRVQDCTIDKGAYEYDGTKDIVPTIDGENAIYYVSETGSGTATGTDKQNAACWEKLQKVLDAAGRYKYIHPSHNVIVRLSEYDGYAPTREVIYNDFGLKRSTSNTSNPRDYSLVVPRGVIVEGGYCQPNIVRLRNRGKGTKYLSAGDNNKVYVYATTEDNYSASLWLIEDAPNGGVYIYNSKTGLYLNQLQYNTQCTLGNNKYEYSKTVNSDGYTLFGYGTNNLNAHGGNETAIGWNSTDNNSQWAIEYIMDDAFSARDVLKYKTTLSGQYSYAGQDVNAYHVVTFTKVVYDEDGKPMTATDTDGNALTDTEGNPIIATLGDDCGRAILDGVCITGGDATGKDVGLVRSTQAVADAYWPGTYGGAAIVPSYAHVRNCIIEGNNASMGGGGLMLKPQALVSGCIIRNNTTSGNGGAIYVYEPNAAETKEIEEKTPAPIDPMLDISLPAIAGPRYPYANIFTSTIVGNSAQNGGGGVYFTNNLRINSSVLWRNSANSNANIAGNYSPQTGSAADMKPWQYPLQFCAVENLRAAGYDNISIESRSALGARWDWIKTGSDDDLLADKTFHYSLKSYSMLTRGGMRQNDWSNIIDGITYIDGESTKTFTYFPTLETHDIAGVKRTAHPDNVYIEIGARVYDDDALVKPTTSNLLKRIFVAMPEDTDVDAAEDMIKSGNEYYNQPGSSMAFPMNRLGDALEYVRNARIYAYNLKNKANATVDEKAEAEEIANTRFEIFVGRGTHYPLRTIKGSYSNTRGNTFLVPEGVAIYGGINYAQRDLGLDGYLNTETKITGQPATVVRHDTKDILNERETYDVNQNGIIEGWGMMHQTVLSGDVINSDMIDNVFHVVTAIAAEEYVGLLPTSTSVSTATWDGKEHAENGVPIILDGLQIRDGQAYKYDPAVQSNSTYYKGGAILIDGNWTTGTTNTNDPNQWIDTHRETNLPDYNKYKSTNADDQEAHASTRRVRGYRNIPLVIRNSLVTNNIASFGGAVSTNGALEIYSSQFAQNRVVMHSENVNFDDGQYTMTYSGRGGAIEASGDMTAVNTIFANNSALSDDVEIDAGKHRANGTGGAIMLGEYATLRLLNCNVVRNEATAYPALYSFNLNKGGTDVTSNPIKVVNTLFWGNNNLHPSEHDGNHHAFDLVLNVAVNEDYSTNDKTEIDNKPESLWFCAYEKGKWRTPVTVNDLNVNYRAIDYNDGTTNKKKYIPNILKQQLGEAYANKNFNVIISGENSDTDGPNFISPSVVAGYQGYLPSADWMLGRINSLVDKGWTYLNQTIINGVASFTPKDGVDGNGIYYYYRSSGSTEIANDGYINMPLLDESYQLYNSDKSKLRRVSLDPNPTHFQTYIDIGAYEYQHVQLNESSVKQVDILWVTENERQDVGVSDGSTPAKATSDLQRAIETLLSSRNGHDKEIRLIRGNYFPVYTIGNNLAFTVSTTALDQYAVAPNDGSSYGINSLTIRGGYAEDGSFDIANNTTKLFMEPRNGVTDNLLQHVIIIEDASNRKTSSSGTASSNTVIPITIEALTFANSSATYHKDEELNNCPGGAAITYKPQKDMNDIELPKLTIKNCVFSHNGATPASGEPAVAAVTIAKGGGGALIFNSLFNNNTGHSLVAADTKVVNCTFAKNGGGVILDSGSEVYNSILWQNGGAEISGFETDDKLNILGEESKISDSNIASNAINMSDVPENNSSLSDVNNDILQGPNFVAPESGNYTLLPSQKTINQAKSNYYSDYILKVLNPNDNYTIPEGYAHYTTMSTSDVSANGVELHEPRFLLYRDLAGNIREYDSKIDLGAYESMSRVDRVMYVIPNKSTEGSGVDWENAYSRAQMQTAIDAAAIYASSHTGSNAYVFVKGFNDSYIDAVTLRNGVHIYGSVQNDFNSTISTSATDSEILNYVTTLINDPDRAIAASSARRSVINGLTASETGMTGLIDGFEIVSATASTLTSPAIDVASGVGGVVVRNCIVHDFNMDGTEVVSLKGKSLLYNCLIRDVKAEGKPIISASDDSYVINCTVVTPDVNATSLIQAPEGLSINNLVYAGDVTANSAPFAPYFHKKNFFYHSDLNFSSLTDNKNLWYQLAEQAVQLQNGTFSTYSDKWFKNHINYKTDRDILGNPRMIKFGSDIDDTATNKIDRGCFETWTTGLPSSPVALYPNTESSLYGGNYYPHEGSVVYIQQGGSIVLNHKNDDTPYFNREQVFRPGYLLVREGGSLYGQGNSVQLSYVSVQRSLPDRYAMVSLPFDFKVSTADGKYTTFAQLSYDNSGGIYGNGGFDVDKVKIYIYDGEKRAASDYKYDSDDSECWTEVAVGSVIPANKGWLLDLGEATDARIVRFNAFGSKVTDWIYSEGDVPERPAGTPIPNRTVTLHQYDDRKWEDEPGFTSQYNMGWNLVGLPLLISNYGTAPKDNNDKYAMHQPHVLYKLGNEGKYQTALESWNDGVTISVGEAFFTQTSTLDTQEVLTFAVPNYDVSSLSAPMRHTLTVSNDDGVADEVEIRPSEAGNLGYTFGNDGLKMSALSDDATQIFASDGSGIKMSLMASAPMGIDIPIGIKTASGGSGQYRLELASPDFWQCDVWLIDRLTGSTVNLVDDGYDVMMEGGETFDRFALHFGALNIDAPHRSERKIYTPDGQLTIDGLTPGRTVRIYDLKGRCYQTVEVEATTYSFSFTPGTYIVCEF